MVGRDLRFHTCDALIAAGHHGLDNLVMMVDNNRMQADGSTADVMGVEPVPEKLEAFGIAARRLDSNSIDEVFDAFAWASIEVDRPASCARTCRGKASRASRSTRRCTTSAPPTTSGLAHSRSSVEGRRVCIHSMQRFAGYRPSGSQPVSPYVGPRSACPDLRSGACRSVRMRPRSARDGSRTDSQWDAEFDLSTDVSQRTAHVEYTAASVRPSGMNTTPLTFPPPPSTTRMSSRVLVLQSRTVPSPPPTATDRPSGL